MKATDDPLIKTIYHALDSSKAINTQMFQPSHLSDITDYMLITSGNSHRQIRAIAEHILVCAKKIKIMPLGVEGLREEGWILLDFGHIIAHIMHPDTRDYYQPEKLWDADQNATDILE